MDQRSVDPAAIEAEVDHVRSLGIDALRKRWRMTFGAIPPKGLTKDIIARMIAYRIQEEAFGGLDRETVKLLDRLARGEKPSELNRRLKAGTVLVREYQGERHTVTVVPDGFLWRETTYSSLSTIARAITGTAWNGPRFFGLRVPGEPEPKEPPQASRRTLKADQARTLLGPDQRRNNRGRGFAMDKPTKKLFRCAIYTRKSTDHNLDLEFNSLDAQREACEAYIKSQAHEGWRLIPAHYDDGAFSGASLDRPALQELLAEVRGRQDRYHRGLQGRPADPVAGGLRQAGRAVRPAFRLVRLGHPVLQHHQQHGAAHPQRAAVLRPVRA